MVQREGGTRDDSDWEAGANRSLFVSPRRSSLYICKLRYNHHAQREVAFRDGCDWEAGASRPLFANCVSGTSMLGMLQDLLRPLPAPLWSHERGCSTAVVPLMCFLCAQVPNMPTSSAVTVNGTWSNTSSTFLSMRCTSVMSSPHVVGCRCP